MDALATAKRAMTELGLSPERLIEMVVAETRRRKGRKVPSLPEFTFPVSGYTTKVRKIGPWTLDQVRITLKKVKKEPSVPVQKVPDEWNDAGDVTGWRMEANDADPDYKTAKKEYDEWLAESAGYRLIDIIMSSCVIVDSEDLDLQEIEAHRKSLTAAGPLVGEEGHDAHVETVKAMSDEEIFVRCICIQSGEDLVALRDFVTSKSMPTPQEINEQVETFRPEVQRETPNGDRDPQVWVPI